jgi:DNA-binding NarL/FixJ family response regulator
MSKRGTLIVFERNTGWVVPLRLALGRSVSGPGKHSAKARPLAAGVDYRLVETRTAEDCLAALAEDPWAVVGIELTAANVEPALHLTRVVAERFPGARVVVLAARELADHECLTRELGAAGFVTSPRRLDEFLSIARRHWARRPQLELGAAESAWATLPWE